MEFHFTDNLTGFGREMSDLAAGIQHGIGAAAAELGERLETAVEEQTPVRTGRLRRSTTLHVERDVGGVTAAVAQTEVYAHPVYRRRAERGLSTPEDALEHVAREADRVVERHLPR